MLGVVRTESHHPPGPSGCPYRAVRPRPQASISHIATRPWERVCWANSAWVRNSGPESEQGVTPNLFGVGLTASTFGRQSAPPEEACDTAEMNEGVPSCRGGPATDFGLATSSAAGRRCSSNSGLYGPLIPALLLVPLNNNEWNFPGACPPNITPRSIRRLGSVCSLGGGGRSPERGLFGGLAGNGCSRILTRTRASTALVTARPMSRVPSPSGHTGSGAAKRRFAAKEHAGSNNSRRDADLPIAPPPPLDFGSAVCDASASSRKHPKHSADEPKKRH